MNAILNLLQSSCEKVLELFQNYNTCNLEKSVSIYPTLTSLNQSTAGKSLHVRTW